MSSNGTSAQAGALQGWILTASCWLAVIGAILIAPILPFMEKEFSYLPNANALVTLTLALPALMITIFSPLVGSLVDAIGRKRVLIISLIIYAIAGTAPVWLGNIYAIIGTRLVVGITEAALTVVATALTADYFLGHSRQRWLALQTGSAAVVAVVAFGLGGFLGGQALGWRTPFLVYGGVIVLLPLMIAFIWEPGRKLTQIPSAVAARQPFPWRRIGHITLITVFAAVGFYVVPVQLSFLLNDRGFTTPEQIGAASAIANIGVPVGALIFNLLSRLPVMRLLTASLGLFAAGFTILARFPDPQITTAGAFIACLGGGIALPLLITWTLSRVNPEQRGRGAGGFNGAFFFGQFLSPVLVGMLGAGVGGLVPAIGVLSWVFAGAAILTLLYSLTRSGVLITVAASDTQHGIE
jgi:MFS family permease